MEASKASRSLVNISSKDLSKIELLGIKRTFIVMEAKGAFEYIRRERVDAYIVLFGGESQELLDDPAILAGTTLYLEYGVIDPVAVGCEQSFYFCALFVAGDIIHR